MTTTIESLLKKLPNILIWTGALLALTPYLLVCAGIIDMPRGPQDRMLVKFFAASFVLIVCSGLIKS